MKTETATVFRCSDGHRRLTAKGAAFHEATVTIAKKCDCDRSTWHFGNEMREVCKYHEAAKIGASYGERLRARLAKLILRKFRRENPAPKKPRLFKGTIERAPIPSLAATTYLHV